ncbi:MAG: dTMP kinase [Thermodesulfovibrionales bacterium]|nr:dTMP kinase [Thermodesulfovibrionales bacterium]
MKGILISFEGIEGTGKTIQSRLLYEYLAKEGCKVILTEEPGGTRIGLKIRDLLLSAENRGMTPVSELLLYNASRAQHIKEVILPALKIGSVVITDRFIDSTVAYQGYGRGIDLKLIDFIERIVTEGLKPDITLLLDLDVEIGLKRNRGINKTDRLELEDLEFHKRVRDGYLEIAAKEPERIKLIDASESIEEVYNKIVSIVTDVVINKMGNNQSPNSNNQKSYKFGDW